ncbi:MAG: hypothetical protein ACRCYY_19810 [Trueperaceae bacterium]
MNIELHIERLVLDGVPLSRVQAQHMQGMLEVELSRLLSEGGLAPQLLQGGAVPSLRGGEIIGSESSRGLGQQVAQAVYGEVGGKRE